MSNIEPICEYDSNGNPIHYRDSNGLEGWYEYDNRGNLIHYKESSGYEFWCDSDGNRIHKPTEKKDNTAMALNAHQTIGFKWSELPSVDWEGNTPIIQYTHDKKDFIVVDIISHECENDQSMEIYIPVVIEEWTDDEGYHVFIDPVNLKDGMIHDAWISRDVVSKEYEYIDFVNDIKDFSPYISQVLCGNSGRLYSVYDIMDHYERKIARLNMKIAELEGNNNA